MTARLAAAASCRSRDASLRERASRRRKQAALPAAPSTSAAPELSARHASAKPVTARTGLSLTAFVTMIACLSSSFHLVAMLAPPSDSGGGRREAAGRARERRAPP